MAGKGDSGAKGGVIRRLGSGTGTWRVTGQEGLEGRHGEVLSTGHRPWRGGSSDQDGSSGLGRRAVPADQPNDPRDEACVFA